MKKFGHFLRRFSKWIVIFGLIGFTSTLCLNGVMVDSKYSDLHISLGAEILGAVVIYLLIESFVSGAEREKELKAQFIGMMGSADNEVALRGAAELFSRGWLSDGTLCGQDLRHANLSGLVLKGYRDPNTGEVKSPNLENVDLSNANLRDAKLLDNANLRGAKLCSARLNGIKMQNAILNDATLEGADFSLQRKESGGWLYFEPADLRNAQLEGAVLNGTNLQSADFSGANLRNARFEATELASSERASAGDPTVELSNAKFVEADLTGAIMTDALMQDVDFTNATLRDSQLQEARLNRAVFNGADLTNANLAKTIHIENAKCDKDTILPDGKHFIAGDNLSRYKGYVGWGIIGNHL